MYPYRKDTNRGVGGGDKVRDRSGKTWTINYWSPPHFDTHDGRGEMIDSTGWIYVKEREPGFRAKDLGLKWRAAS